MSCKIFKKYVLATKIKTNKNLVTRCFMYFSDTLTSLDKERFGENLELKAKTWQLCYIGSKGFLSTNWPELRNYWVGIRSWSVLYRNHDWNSQLSFYFAQECSQCSLYVLDDQHLADAFGVVYCYPVSASEEYRKQLSKASH